MAIAFSFLGLILIARGGPILSMFTYSTTLGQGLGVLFICLSCGLVFATIVGVTSGAINLVRRRSTPHAVLQPVVPTTAPIARTCPNCGTPPQAADGSGLITCAHCGTRFIVR